VTANLFEFKVYYAAEIKPNDEVITDPKKHSLLFEFEDHVLASGFLGFTSNDSKGIVFD